MDLGVPLDKRGLIDEKDIHSLRGMRKWLEATFANDLARGAGVTASNVRGGDKRFSAENLLYGNGTAYWATDDEVKTSEVVLNLHSRTTFNVVRLREYLPLGQRVDEFALDAWQGTQWSEFFRGTSIGSQRLVHVPRIASDKVRLRITKASACPALSALGLFLEPDLPLLRTIK